MHSAFYKEKGKNKEDKKVKTFLQSHQVILIFSTSEKNPCQNDISGFVVEGVEKALAETIWLSALSYFRESKGLYLAFAEPAKDSSTVSHKQPRGICMNLDVQISL